MCSLAVICLQSSEAVSHDAAWNQRWDPLFRITSATVPCLQCTGVVVVTRINVAVAVLSFSFEAGHGLLQPSDQELHAVRPARQGFLWLNAYLLMEPCRSGPATAAAKSPHKKDQLLGSRRRAQLCSVSLLWPTTGLGDIDPDCRSQNGRRDGHVACYCPRT